MTDLEALYSTPLEKLPIAVLDLETTGLHPHTDAICELGAVQMKSGQVIASFSSLVNPQREIPAQVVAIHHLTSELLQTAPLLPEILPTFIQFLGNSVLAGHNAAFDLSFLSPVTRPLGISLNQRPILDTAFLARRLLPKQKGYSLSKLAQSLELPTTRFHRALDDATTTAYLLDYILKQAQARGIRTLAQLQEQFPHNAILHEQPDLSPLEQTLWHAIEHAISLEIQYCNRDGEIRQRRISPQRLAPPYLYAYCHFRQEQRCFRLNRIETFQLFEQTEVHKEPEEPPTPAPPLDEGQ